jgi:putative membrane protein insertion efficiency factor
MNARLRSPFSARLALLGVRAYQILVRPLLAGTGGCRFVPSCSEYAAESIATYGAFRGGFMALKRLLRCHPLGGSGLDPVPHSGPAKPDTTIS